MVPLKARIQPKSEQKLVVSVRYSPEVVAYFKSRERLASAHGYFDASQSTLHASRVNPAQIIPVLKPGSEDESTCYGYQSFALRKSLADRSARFIGLFTRRGKVLCWVRWVATRPPEARHQARHLDGTQTQTK